MIMSSCAGTHAMAMCQQFSFDGFHGFLDMLFGSRVDSKRTPAMPPLEEPEPPLSLCCRAARAEVRLVPMFLKRLFNPDVELAPAGQAAEVSA